MRISGLSIRQLEAFDMIMRTGSVSSAAIALHISQPSASRLLQDLERDCGFNLFDRTRGRLVPTPQAMVFHDEVARSFKSARDLMAAARDIRDLKRSKLRIGALAAVSLQMLPAILQQFRATYPGVRTNVAVRSSVNIVAAVASLKLDVGIIDGAISSLDTLIASRHRFPTVCAMDANHPLTARKTISLDDLQPYPFVSLGEDYLARSPAGRALLDTLEERVEVETFQSFLACGFLIGTNAVAVVDQFTASFYNKMGIVYRPLLDEIPLEIAIITNHRSNADHGVAAFTRLIENSLLGIAS